MPIEASKSSAEQRRERDATNQPRRYVVIVGVPDDMTDDEVCFHTGARTARRLTKRVDGI